MKRFIPLTALIIFIFSASTLAQFEIGASYELRDEDPQSGFGLRIQKGFTEALPMIDIGIRAHASYFNEQNSLSQSGATYSQDFTNYDFGVAAYGGISLGLLQPYVGLGLGSETTDLSSDDVQGENRDESNIYWNTFAGAKVTVIPFLKPFLEYRYSNKQLSEPTLADAQNGRIIFGISLSF
ncbi:MAG: outer membrane beta-barrel protein [Balneolaceae bacterium]